MMGAMDQLTGNDRCDRCGAVAQLRAKVLSGAELLFCGHHGDLNKDALARKGWEIFDQRQPLVKV